MTRNPKSDIAKLLLLQGFSAVGFSPAAPVSQSWQEKFRQWLAAGNHNGLQWLERNIEKRNNPALLHQGTHTIISMLHPWPEMTFDSGPLKIAAYAHGADYHNYLKQQAEPVINLIAAADPDFRPKFITDSVPFFDRYWAWKAGLGFIGKNGFLINPSTGSRVLIAHILTSLKLESETETIENNCGNCTKCIESCPVGAFNGDGTIDARKCIACLTIESKENIHPFVADKNPGWIFGCDICQQVCPYNQTSFTSVYSDKMKGNWIVPETKKEWMVMSEAEFAEKYSHTPLKRAGLEKIRQNIRQLHQN